MIDWNTLGLAAIESAVICSAGLWLGFRKREAPAPVIDKGNPPKPSPIQMIPRPAPPLSPWTLLSYELHPTVPHHFLVRYGLGSSTRRVTVPVPTGDVDIPSYLSGYSRPSA